MSDRDLHDQLERLGRRPVPPPRPEFVESLLARIQLTDDLREPAPVIYLRRKTWAGARVVFAGAAAAVLLGAVGMLALARGGSDPSTKVNVQAASGTADTVSAEVEDGKLVVSSSEELEDGEHTATCTQGGVLKYEGGSLDCDTGDMFILVTAGGKILSATPIPSAVETPAEETPTTVTTPDLELTSTEQGAGVSLIWSAATATGPTSYVVVRKVGGPEDAQPPAIAAPTDGEVRQEISQAGPVTVEESFEDLDPTNDKVAYRVFALDSDGNVVAQSRTLILTLQWEQTTVTTR